MSDAMNSDPMNSDPTSSDRTAFGDLPEEAWEGEIGRLLADLPMMDPPEGFIDQALNHRPLYSGRTTVLALAASVLSIVVVSMTGLLADEMFVPDLEALLSRHSATEAGLLGGVIPTGGSGNADYVFEVIEEPAEAGAASVVLPSEFEWEASFGVKDLRQRVFAADGQTVSVFHEPGQIDFTELPVEGLLSVDGVVAWADPSRDLVIMQTTDSAVTIIGMSPEGLGEMMEGLEVVDGPSRWRRFSRRINRVTRQLGFPDLTS